MGASAVYVFGLIAGFICRISQVHRLLALPPRIVSWNFSWFPPIVRLQVHLYHGPRPIIRRVNDAVVLASSMHCLCRTKNSASNLQPLGAQSWDLSSIRFCSTTTERSTKVLSLDHPRKFYSSEHCLTKHIMISHVIPEYCLTNDIWQHQLLGLVVFPSLYAWRTVAICGEVDVIETSLVPRAIVTNVPGGTYNVHIYMGYCAWHWNVRQLLIRNE